MAWIESHQELARHPKTKKLARLLGVTTPAAIGHLHMFWWWAMDYAQSGDISRFDPEDIADAVDWPAEDAATFLECMSSAGFIDDSFMIHDWHDYAGRLIEKREQNRDRKRKSRTKTDSEKIGHAPVTRPSQGKERDGSECHRATNPTLPTQPNPTEPNQHNHSECVTESERLRHLANSLNLKGLGIDGLETICSYLGQTDVEVIEKALKMAEGKHVNYFVSIINGFIAEGKTSKDSLSSIPEPGSNPPRNTYGRRPGTGPPSKPVIPIAGGNGKKLSDEEMEAIIQKAGKWEEGRE